jgi:hypothetical protein
MDLLLRFEIIALLALPFLMAILHKRGVMFEKQMAFTVATLLSLISGSYYLKLRNPVTLFSLKLEDWLVAIALASLCWVFVYPFSRWLHKQWFQN